MTRDRSRADDLAQSAALRALAKADQFQPDSHLDRWIFTIARRLWLNELRADGVRHGAGQVPVEEVELAATAPSTETNIFAGEVYKLIQALPDGQRLAVLLVYLEGYSYKEAAEMMEIPIGTVMSRLSTARRTIAAGVAQEEETV